MIDTNKDGKISIYEYYMVLCLIVKSRFRVNEYFKGINKLKNNRLSNLTLYHLNNENSPYKKNQTDLMEIKLFLKKSNKNDLKGKTTTDYFDYAILISNSQANKPIEELDK